ncbi:hypothetical protein HN873_001936 [Arachis hypogaea]
MSKETVTDPTLSPLDLTEEPMSNLINIFRTNEQSADLTSLRPNFSGGRGYGRLGVKRRQRNSSSSMPRT